MKLLLKLCILCLIITPLSAGSLQKVNQSKLHSIHMDNRSVQGYHGSVMIITQNHSQVAEIMNHSMSIPQQHDSTIRIKQDITIHDPNPVLTQPITSEYMTFEDVSKAFTNRQPAQTETSFNYFEQ